MAGQSYSAKPIQIIEGQYLDQKRLMRLLRDVYGTSDEGKNNFRVEVRYWYMTLYLVAKNVTPAQTQSVQNIPF
jgi:hypothetical protein